MRTFFRLGENFFVKSNPGVDNESSVWFPLAEKTDNETRVYILSNYTNKADAAYIGVNRELSTLLASVNWRVVSIGSRIALEVTGEADHIIYLRLSSNLEIFKTDL